MKTDGVKANGGNADTLGGKGISYFAKDGHKHQKADIEGFPEKLPADGGNADTVAGKNLVLQREIFWYWMGRVRYRKKISMMRNSNFTGKHSKVLELVK